VTVAKPITVEPDYTKSGIEASETFKNRVSDSGAKYPISIGDHSLQVKYRFDKDYGGLLQLMEITYYCTECGDEKGVTEQGELWSFDKKQRRELRKYVLGYFVETDCQ
jgi:hypothetical protein